MYFFLYSWSDITFIHLFFFLKYDKSRYFLGSCAFLHILDIFKKSKQIMISSSEISKIRCIEENNPLLVQSKYNDDSVSLNSLGIWAIFGGSWALWAQ